MTAAMWMFVADLFWSEWNLSLALWGLTGLFIVSRILKTKTGKHVDLR